VKPRLIDQVAYRVHNPKIVYPNATPSGGLILPITDTYLGLPVEAGGACATDDACEGTVLNQSAARLLEHSFAEKPGAAACDVQVIDIARVSPLATIHAVNGFANADGESAFKATRLLVILCKYHGAFALRRRSYFGDENQLCKLGHGDTS